MGAELYERQGDFSEDDAAAKGGRSEQDSAQLDAELDRVLLVVNLHAADIDVLLRDDGTMVANILLGHEFSAESITVLKGQVGNDSDALNWRGQWLTGSDYLIGDLVYEDGSSYFVLVDHEAGTFSTDLGNTKLELFALKGSSSGLPASGADDAFIFDGVGGWEAGKVTLAMAPLHAPKANPTFTGTLVADIATLSGLLTVNGGIALAANKFNPGLTTKDAASVKDDPEFSFNGGIIQSIDVDAPIAAMTTADRVAGNLTEVRFEPDSVNRSITVNPNWTWLGSVPTQILANKTAIMALRCYGSAETDVVAVWNEEA